MNLIAIEASTEMCSVGMLHNDQITHRSEVAPQQHAELILGIISDLLAEQNLKKSDIQGIVLGQGPGAFTGVRIGLSITQGLALGLGVPVFPVSTMENMAHQLHTDPDTPRGRLLIGNDARMGEVYWASFNSGDSGLVRECPDQLDKPESINPDQFDVCAGSAFNQMLKASSITRADLLPNATALLALAKPEFPHGFQSVNQINPQYIREQVVQS